MAKEKKPRSEAQIEAEKRYNAKREPRRSAWTLIFYPDSAPEYWRDILSNLHLKIWVSPLHDSDKWSKADEAKNPAHKAGQLKKPHYHLIVLYPNAVTHAEALSDFGVLNGVQKFDAVKDVTAMVRYLVHADDQDKAQYKSEDVLLFGGASLDYLEELGKGELRAELRAMRKHIRENNITEFDLFWDYCDDCMERWSYILDERCYGIEKYIKARRARQRDEAKQALLSGFPAHNPRPIAPEEINPALLDQQQTPIYDANGVRWCKCTSCGIHAPIDAFAVYGGQNMNAGICRNCFEEGSD